MRWLWLGLLTATVARIGAPQDHPEEQVYTEQVDESVLREIDEYLAREDWRPLFQRYKKLIRENARKLVRSPEGKDKLISFSEYILHRFSQLPRAGLEEYRREFDGTLKLECERGLQNADYAQAERALEMYFFASDADYYSDVLANRYAEQGELARAEMHWRRLLRFYPDPDIDRTAVAAKLLMAARALRSDSALKSAKKLILDRKVEGTVLLGGQQTSLQDLVASVDVREEPPATLTAVPRHPHILLRSEMLQRGVPFPRNDLKRGEYKYGALQENVRIVPQVLPSYHRAGGRDYLIFQDGMVITAVDPQRASLDSDKAGVLWEKQVSKKKPTRSPFRSEYSVRYFGPLMGATVDGNSVYANMYSEQESDDPPQAPQLPMYRPMPLNSINRFEIRSGKLLQNSDKHVYDHKLKIDGRPIEFARDRFFFCAPMVIVGDKLYVGVVTESQSEQESYVVCMNKYTLAIEWFTFLCSSRTQQNIWWGRQSVDYMVYSTMVVHHNGIIYALTNLGKVAALDAATGSICWITGYDRVRPRYDRFQGTQIPGVERSPSPPVVYRNKLYCLPMDGKELYIFDVLTGERSTMDDLPAGYGWENVTHLAGVVNGHLVLTGSRGMVVKNLHTGEVTNQNTSATRPDSGAPFIYNNYVFVPSVKEISKGGELCVYQVGSWRLVEYKAWDTPAESGNLLAADTRRSMQAESGNLLVADDYLIVARSDRLSLWESSQNAFRGQEYRTALSPAEPETVYRYALNLLTSYESRKEVNDLKRAREKFSTFIAIAQGDPKFTDLIRDSKLKLYDVFVKLGDDARIRSRFEEAIELLTAAKEYAPTPQASAQVSLRLAEAYEKAGRPKEAIVEYQEIIERGRNAYFTRSETREAEPMWLFASRRVSEIARSSAPEVAAWLERRAAEALAQAGRDIEALLRLRDHYPTTKVARGIASKIGELIEAHADPRGRLEILRRIRQWYSDLFGLELAKLMLDALEEIEDFARLREELLKLKAAHKDRKVDWSGREQTVGQYVDERLKATECQCPYDLPRITDAVRPIGKLGKVEPGAQAPVRTPLGPQGPVPPELSADWVPMRYGSAVQMWDVRAGKLVWEFLHPGTYLGVFYFGDANGKVVVAQVAEGSPAAGILAQNDVIESVNGRPVTWLTFHEIVQSYRPGEVLSLSVRRGAKVLDVSVKPTKVPVRANFAIVGAAYTAGGRLVVVWEDIVVGLDLKTGKPAWVFDDVGERAYLRSVLAMDGRLFLLEGASSGRAKHPFRTVAAGGATLEVQAHRLILLDDATGAVMRIKEVEMDAAAGALAEGHLFGGYFGSTLLCLLRTNVRAEVRAFTAEGQQVYAQTVISNQTTIFAHVYEPVLHRLYLAYQDPSTTQRVLRAFDGARDVWGDAKPLTNLQADPQSQRLSLAANRDYICVASHAPNGGKIAVFTTDGKPANKVYPIKPRCEVLAMTLPPNEKFLFVYSSPVSPQAQQTGFVACYYLANPDTTAVWETPAPCAAPGGEGWPVLEVNPDCVVLLQNRAYSIGQRSPGPSVAIFGRKKKEGRILFEMSGYDGTNWMPKLSRGRIYMVDRKTQEEVVLGQAREF